MKIFNSLKSEKEDFIPLKEEEISIYVCGMTVYDDCHIGHARTFLSFDSIVRYLRFRGFKVNYIRNITDVDDKILKRSEELNIEPSELTQKYIEEKLASTFDNNELVEKAMGNILEDREIVTKHILSKVKNK